MGTDLFAFHGYSVLFVEGRWRKASPAFNHELCARFGVLPHGDFADLPFEQIMDTYARTYPALSGLTAASSLSASSKPGAVPAPRP